MKCSFFLIPFLLLFGGGVAGAEESRQLLDEGDPEMSPEIVWSTRLGDVGEITVIGDVVLAGCTNGGRQHARDAKRWTRVVSPREGSDRCDNAMVCLDARTGAPRWRAVHPQVLERRRGLPCSPITSRPAVDGDRVYYLTVA